MISNTRYTIPGNVRCKVPGTGKKKGWELQIQVRSDVEEIIVELQMITGTDNKSK